MTDLPKDPADPNVVPGGNDKEPKTVTREAYETLLTEKKNVGKRMKDLETQLQTFIAKEREREEEAARKTGDFEKVLNETKAQLETERGIRTKLENERLEARKYHAFVKGLGTNLDSKFSPLVDLDRVKVDAEGKIDEKSVADYVKEFKETYSETVSDGSGAPGMPGHKPKGGGGTLTTDAWAALPLAERRARLAEVVAASK